MEIIMQKARVAAREEREFTEKIKTAIPSLPAPGTTRVSANDPITEPKATGYIGARLGGN
jgi:hypothetical protein